MKLSKKSLNFLIISIYMIVLLLNPGDYFKFSIIDTIRRFLVVILPIIFIVTTLFDNRKNIKCLLEHKYIFAIYILTILWLLLTFLFGINRGIESLKGLIHFSTLLTFIFILFNINYDSDEKNIIKKHLFISFFISVIIGIIQYVFQINLNTYNNDKYPGILGRINSTYFIATLFDKYIVMMFPLITYELLNDKDNKWYKILLIASMLGITFTFSRSGQLIYFVMSFIFFIITLFKKQFKNSILMVLIIICMILIPGEKYVMQSAFDYAYETFHIPTKLQLNVVKLLGGYEEVKEVEPGICPDGDCVGDLEGSKFFRDYYKSVGMQLLKEHPVFGVGVGNYSYLYLNQNAKDYLKDDSIISDDYPYMYPHCGYVQLMAETGYVGFILIITFLLSIVISKFKNLENKLDIYPIFILLFAFLISNITECLFHSKQYIYIFAIIFVLFAENKRKKQPIK